MAEVSSFISAIARMHPNAKINAERVEVAALRVQSLRSSGYVSYQVRLITYKKTTSPRQSPQQDSTPAQRKAPHPLSFLRRGEQSTAK
ncbi:MAG: hypothetical protein KME31_02115 [Tolypothrix carrinoi HA7290-LM1]|jgi:hypothetical protein|nr:hypothetical protein [Tolypothrix carrinoi HA7290-LM1]